MKSKNPPATSKSKPPPVAKKGTKPAQKKPTKQAGEAVPSGVKAKENEPEVKQESKTAVQLGSHEWVTHSYSTPGTDFHIMMPKDIAKHHGDPAHPEKKAYSRIDEQIKGDIEWLKNRALRGEWDSIKMLAELGITAAAILGGITRVAPDSVKRVARTFNDWPMVISPEPDYPQNAEELRKLIELGKEVALRDDKVLFNKKPLLQREVVLHVVSIFQNLRQLVASGKGIDDFRKLVALLSQVDVAGEKSKEGDAAALALHIATLQGEIRRAETRNQDSRARVQYEKQKLKTLLKIPADSPKVELELIKQGCDLPPLSSATKDQWVKFVNKFIIALIRNELEENEVLRKLGDSRGDVEIRRFAKKATPEEFKERKLGFRHNDAVNGAIRNRIKEKLSDAFDMLVAERQ